MLLVWNQPVARLIVMVVKVSQTARKGLEKYLSDENFLWMVDPRDEPKADFSYNSVVNLMTACLWI